MTVNFAVLRAMQLDDRLVHYSHSCDLSKNWAYREKQHQKSCEGTVEHWGGFGGITFMNAYSNRLETVKHLKEQINVSTVSDPLWIIEAGEPDIIYEAAVAAQSNKLAHVHIVTHHPHNDVGLKHNLSDIVALGANKVAIPDQNTNLKKPLAEWHWARDHKDARLKWLWERGLLAEQDPNVPYIKGKFDCSDAGMVYYWATGATNGGNETPTVADLKKLFLDYSSGRDAGVQK